MLKNELKGCLALLKLTEVIHHLFIVIFFLLQIFAVAQTPGKTPISIVQPNSFSDSLVINRPVKSAYFNFYGDVSFILFDVDNSTKLYNCYENLSKKQYKSEFYFGFVPLEIANKGVEANKVIIQSRLQVNRYNN